MNKLVLVSVLALSTAAYAEIVKLNGVDADVTIKKATTTRTMATLNQPITVQIGSGSYAIAAGDIEYNANMKSLLKATLAKDGTVRVGQIEAGKDEKDFVLKAGTAIEVFAPPSNNIQVVAGTLASDTDVNVAAGTLKAKSGEEIRFMNGMLTHFALAETKTFGPAQAPAGVRYIRMNRTGRFGLDQIAKGGNIGPAIDLELWGKRYPVRNVELQNGKVELVMMSSSKTALSIGGKDIPVSHLKFDSKGIATAFIGIAANGFAANSTIYINADGSAYSDKLDTLPAPGIAPPVVASAPTPPVQPVAPPAGAVATKSYTLELKHTSLADITADAKTFNKPFAMALVLMDAKGSVLWTKEIADATLASLTQKYEFALAQPAAGKVTLRVMATLGQRYRGEATFDLATQMQPQFTLGVLGAKTNAATSNPAVQAPPPPTKTAPPPPVTKPIVRDTRRRR